jgi:hypothetical protein
VGITNNIRGQITVSGGSLTIAGTSTTSNLGTISLQSGCQLQLSGSTLANAGSINLNSSTIAGSGLLNNTSGNVSGPGTILVPFANPGGSLSVPLGTTTVAATFSNSGAILIGGVGANLAGGPITNYGTILGSGAVVNSCNNAGIIEGLGGALIFSGSVQNASGGQISAADGGEVVLTAGLANNYGVISLTGGIFDNNAHPLTNNSQLSGYGTWQTGGLTNMSLISLTGSASTVNGPVTNASAGTINVSYNPAIFTGNVINNGYVKSTSTSVTWAGGFTNNGTYHSDPAQNYFSSLANGPTGLVLGGIGDGFFVTGPLATNAGWIDLGLSSTMVVDNGTGLLSQTAGTLEMGTGATLSAGTVAINGGILLADGPGGVITANLVYGSSTASTYVGVLAGVGDSLLVSNPFATLVLSGSDNSYSAGTLVAAGELFVTSPGGIESGTALAVGSDLGAFGAVLPAEGAAASLSPVPEPGTLTIVAQVWPGVPLLRGGEERVAHRRAALTKRGSPI